MRVPRGRHHSPTTDGRAAACGEDRYTAPSTARQGQGSDADPSSGEGAPPPAGGLGLTRSRCVPAGLAQTQSA
jgi:hypothetical protein